MKTKNTVSEFIYPFKIKSLSHAYKEILNGSSIMRLIHNYFLKNVNINNKVLDIGSSNFSSYYNFLNKNLKHEIFFVDKNIFKKNKNYIKADLEKKIKIQNTQYDTVLMFNILEHLRNYNQLILEGIRLLKKKGNLEIFVPFMYRYHENPKDYVRLSHYYLKMILEKNKLNYKITLIGAGPFVVCCEILSGYLGFTILKFILFIFCLMMDRLVGVIKKDLYVHYLGVHCSCEKS
jgi:SAM-dependent methyltransferase